MGKALYRKYRSKSLDEVIGQEHITNTLKKALDTGAISHAYLFTGPRGVGKTSVARILAYAINDIPYEDESTHLDIIEIDAASNRRIDEIRELRDKIHIAPTSAKYKVYIIDEVHMLTREAFNALLKTLEEPPEHAVFILATTEAHKVPETIVSRTQRFQFKPISKKYAIDHLKNLAKQEKITIDQESLELLAEHGSGSFRDSISMLDQVSGQRKTVTVDDVRLLLGIPPQQLIDDLVEAIKEQSMSAVFSSLEAIKEQGIDAGQLTKILSSHLRQQLIDSTTSLSQDKTLALLHDLLGMTATSIDYYHLEVVLLRHAAQPTSENKNEQKQPIQTQSEQKTVTHKDSASSNVTITPHAEKQPKIKLSANLEQPITNTPDVRHDDYPKQTQESKQTGQKTPEWSHLISEIKKTHNTLYGLLRLSTVEVKDEELVIYFAFPFHKKQIDSAKHQEVLKKAIQKEYGNKTFRTAVRQPDTQSQPAHETKNASRKETDELSNISNIFGGAELLES